MQPEHAVAAQQCIRGYGDSWSQRAVGRIAMRYDDAHPVHPATQADDDEHIVARGRPEARLAEDAAEHGVGDTE